MTGPAPIPPLICPRCGRSAPRLITWREAGRPTPLAECPRCAYPTTRYLGAETETMPITDLTWYARQRLVFEEGQAA